MVDFWENLGRFTHFAVRSLGVLPWALLRPRELHRQLHQVLLGALPLAGVAGLAMGVVIWMHLHGVLTRFGPGYKQLLPQALALGVVLEFAPITAGCIVASRTGAGLGAEFGSMRLTEQLDALEVLGLSPLKELIAPRVLACMLALPLLTVFVDYLALTGSYGAEVLGGSLSWMEYRNACLSRLRLEDVIPATLKTVIFGYLIGVTGCYCGMHAQGGTEGVGRAATRGVVASLFLVVLANVLLVRIIQLLNG